MSPNFIESDKTDSSEQFDYEFSHTSTSNDTENKGIRSFSFIEKVDQDGGNMSMWNIILLSTALVGLATIVITVTCLVCFCCIMDKRKHRQKNSTQYCSPDILMNVAGNLKNLLLQILIYKCYVSGASTHRESCTDHENIQGLRNERPSVIQDEIRNSSPLRESEIEGLSVINNIKPTIRMPNEHGICFDPASPKTSTLTSLRSLSEISFSNNQMNMYASKFSSVLTLSRETIV